MSKFIKGSRVRFVRPPSNTRWVPHFDLAKEYLDVGKLYTVEHVFIGEPEQIEIVGIEYPLFIAEMFDLAE